MPSRLFKSLSPAACTGMMLLAALCGCANGPFQAKQTADANVTPGSAECTPTLTPANNTRLTGIEQLVTEDKPYAALAQLDALGERAPQSDLVRADALRRIDRISEARAIYARLQGSCVDGRARHGLGLIAAREGLTAESLAYLQQARQVLPTDTKVRNDLGYALLLAGQFDAAQFEFLTVLELSPQDPRASRNLVLLTFKQGQSKKASALAAKLGLDSATTDKLQQQALSQQTMLENTPPAAARAQTSIASSP